MGNEPTPGTTGASEPTPGQTGDGNQPTPGNTGGDEKVTLTKSELDAKMAEVRRGVEKSVSQKYEGFEDIQKKAAEFDKLQAEQMTEVEKAKTAQEAADAKAAKLEAELKVERTNSVVAAIASELKFINPTLAPNLLSPGSIEFDEEGRPKKDSVKAALEALVKTNPYLVGAKPPSGDGGGGPRGGGPEGSTVNDWIRRQAGVS